MHSHPLARLTPLGRERLIRRHLEEGVPLQIPPQRLTMGPVQKNQTTSTW
ncbi:hypothetical protein [Synechococcus sp. CBW1107]|nr:hypothetical protein [Synechococcus sp. CBW1107]CAK6690199.1 hypothetical protein ICNINCKA_00760 [Synechococcus sp. CBW1107]